MKLLTVIVQEVDEERVASALRDAGHRFTRFGSQGGYLGTPNVTLMLAVEDGQLAALVETIRRNVSVREVELPLVLEGRLRDWQDRTVNYAGATILVVELSEVIRL